MYFVPLADIFRDADNKDKNSKDKNNKNEKFFTCLNVFHISIYMFYNCFFAKNN